MEICELRGGLLGEKIPGVGCGELRVDVARFVVRVLTGPHEGAEMEISRDGITLGSGEECDLILFDPQVASRHARLTLEGGGVVLHPLQGAVLLDMVSIEDDVELLGDAGQIITVGNTHLAVGFPHSSFETRPIPSIRKGLPAKRKSVFDVVQASPIKKSRKGTSVLLFISMVGVLLAFTFLEMLKHLGKEKGAGKQGTDGPDSLGKVMPLGKVPGHSGLAVAPCLSTLGSIDSSLFPLEAKAADQLSRNMNGGAVFSLAVQGGKPQLRIWVRGGAKSAVARRIISRFSPPLRYHIFDLSQVEASAAMLAQLSGLSLRVRVEPEGIAFWSGYLQHDRMWHDFFPHIARELPIIRNHHCEIVFGNQLVKMLRGELHQRGLRVQPVASASGVVLAGNLPQERKREWDSWMTEVQGRYISQVPIIIDRVNSDTVVGVASRDFFPSRIVGVSGMAGPWVALADGSKFFQGAKLKDGYVLEEITSSMLLLNGPEGVLKLPLSMLD